MKVYNVGTDELSDDYDLRDIRAGFTSDPDLIVYNYETAPYEGSGDMIILKDGKWWHHGLGHCSCNGPCDGFYGKTEDSSDSLPALRLRLSGELDDQLKSVFLKLTELGHPSTPTSGEGSR